MILLLDTSTMTCRLSFVDGDWRYDDEWEAGRSLAKDLLKYLQGHLEQNQKSWNDITGIVAYQGPGSFTGLRIGLTVLNTLADANKLPIIGETGEDWQSQGIGRLKAGENDQLVMPEYGSEANITAPRK